MRRFGNATLQQAYETCRLTGNDPASDFYHRGRPNGGAGHRVAYWMARSGFWLKEAKRAQIERTRFPAGTVLAAAYRAGLDDRALDLMAGNLLAAEPGSVHRIRYPVWTPSEQVQTKVRSLMRKPAR